jgi:hypothetical protein
MQIERICAAVVSEGPGRAAELWKRLAGDERDRPGAVLQASLPAGERDMLSIAGKALVLAGLPTMAIDNKDLTASEIAGLLRRHGMSDRDVQASIEKLEAEGAGTAVTLARDVIARVVAPWLFDRLIAAF